MADIAVPIYTPLGLSLTLPNRTLNTPMVTLATATSDVGEVPARGSTLLIMDALSDTNVAIGTVAGPGGKVERIAFNPFNMGGGDDGIIAVGPLPDQGFRQSDGNIHVEMPASGDDVTMFALDVSGFAQPRRCQADTPVAAETDWPVAAHGAAGGFRIDEAAVFIAMESAPDDGGFKAHGKNMLMLFYQTTALGQTLAGDLDAFTKPDPIFGRRDANLISLAGAAGLNGYYVVGPINSQGKDGDFRAGDTGRVELTNNSGNMEFFCTIALD